MSEQSTITVVSATAQPEAKAEVKPVEQSEAGAAEAEGQAETAAASDASEQEDEEKPAAEDAAEDEGEADEEAPKEEAKPKPQKGLEKRIKRLVKDRNLVTQERDALRAQIEQMKAAQTTSKPEPKIETKDGEPKADDFDTHDAYVRALTRWEVAQAEVKREEKQRAESQKSDHAKMLDRWNEGMTAAKKKFSDYEDVTDAVSDVVIPPAVQRLFLKSENGAELAYELAKTPKEFARICSLDPEDAAEAFGEFKASLKKPAAPQIKKTTNAPAPITPVGSNGSAAPKKSIYDPDLTQEEYEALRKQQSAKRGA